MTASNSARLRHASLGAALLAALGTFPGIASAGGALYHLQVLDVPGGSNIAAKAINDAGQIVGTYQDADFVRHAVLWDATGWHELARPPGDGVDAIAFAINAGGTVVGTADDFVNPTVGVIWNAATPDQYTSIVDSTAAGVRPAGVNADGTIVGGFGVPTRAFVWTAAGGLVDYGVRDETVEDEQARWNAINASGKLVGHWNVHSSDVHAIVGQAGNVEVLSMSAMTDELPSIAVSVNSAGVAAGLGLDVDTASLVPVIFAVDGSFSEIPGATLGTPNGAAASINDAGVVVGTADIGSASGLVPGRKAWVYRDGAVHDLFDVVDDTATFTRFSIASAINASGVIVGSGVIADGSMASFVLTPLAADAVFADGFDQ